MGHAAAHNRLPLRLKKAMHSSALLGLRAILGDSYRKWVFAKIWSENRWGDAESRSGTGSNLRETEHLRKALATLFESLKVRSILDLPCGDFHWMREVPLPAGAVYIGGDIVEPLIARNRTWFGSELRQFQSIDLMRDPLPVADLILCRDGLVHFSFSDIFATLFNFKLSGTEYLLTTHFSGDRANHDIRTGQWRPLNLTNAPFHFPPPMMIIDEHCTERNGENRDKCLALWRIKNLPDRPSFD
jgi:hypothetical protein